MTDEPGPNPAAPLLDNDLLLTYLADRDEDCPACGYNLRQLNRAQCPECGRGLRLSVGLVESLSSSWIVGLVASLIAAGCGLPFLIALLIGFANGLSLYDLTREPQVVILLIVLLYSVGCMGAATFLIAKRQRFMRWSAESQKIFSGLIVAFDLFAAFAVFAVITGDF